MLVLSRKQGERIVIGSGIEIVVISVRGNRVRLGVNAPSEIPVHREELAQRLQAEAIAGHLRRESGPSPPVDRSEAYPVRGGNCSTMDSVC